jgi:CopG family transcriptional regulator, nickel-responsive regulator
MFITNAAGHVCSKSRVPDAACRAPTQIPRIILPILTEWNRTEMNELARFSVSMDSRLLGQFDRLIEARGYENRSEAIRDLVRNALVEEEWASGSERVAATVTLVYSHHHTNVGERLGHIQHHHVGIVVSATHVHLDNDNCLEVVILRGKSREVRALAEELIAIKGVIHGKVVSTTEGRHLH